MPAAHEKENGEKPIRFGIPTLDELLSHGSPRLYWLGTLQSPKEPFGIVVDSGTAPPDAITLAIIGTDGAGKSVLAMHLAATYVADREPGAATVIYASTDLTFERAKRTWDQFALSYPDHRIIDPFLRKDREEREKSAADIRRSTTDLKVPEGIQLHLIDPANPSGLFCTDSPAAPSPASGAATTARDACASGAKDKPDVAHHAKTIHFLDLASKTAGDDWGFLTRLVATLEKPTGESRHLLIIDCVDGLEMMVGRRDAFGRLRDRRSRIAELIRAAAQKCHLLFVSAEPANGQTPEEYIADVVVRVRFRQHGNYRRRSVAIEKVRAQNHVRGEHDLLLRSGTGASTGSQEHFDEPRIVRVDSPLPDPRDDKGKLRGCLDSFRKPDEDIPDYLFQSYVYVAHSLNYVNSFIMRAEGPAVEIKDDEKRYAKFGIRYLDDILEAPAPPSPPAGTPAVWWPRAGLPTHEPAVLIGEDGTHKSRLAKAFLARALLPEAQAVERLPPPEGSPAPQVDNAEHHGIAVLLTTKTLDAQGLLSRIWKEHLGRKTDPPDTAKARVICRRLEYQPVTPGVLFHIIKQSVRAAQRIISKDNEVSDLENERRKIGWKIRLVIDNWASLCELYPEVRDEPLFLPCLLFFLRREGVATLFIANEDRGFSDGFRLVKNQILRDLTQVHLFTWRTQFFGESRVAITVNPPIGAHGHADVIRELSGEALPQFAMPDENQAISVNAMFELFVGLEKGAPEYVPLKVYLYGGLGGDSAYLDDFKQLAGMLLKTDAGADIVRAEPATSYDRLREFCQLQGSTRLPHTLVLQVDEFWAKTGPLHFGQVERYLTAPTAWTGLDEKLTELKTTAMHVEDPFHLFQPSVNTISKLDIGEFIASATGEPRRRIWTRAQLFSTEGYDLQKHIQERSRSLVKVPYTWDFGFLMCHADLWQAAEEVFWNRLVKLKEVQQETAPAGINAHGEQGTAPPCIEAQGDRNVTWRDFVETCATVTQFANRQFKEGRRFSTFGVAPETHESLSCLLLEIWASEIALDPAGGKNPFDTPRTDPEESEFPKRIQAFGPQLWRALALLLDLIPHNLIGQDNRLTQGENPDAPPVAVRSWYSTAAALQSRHEGDDQYVPVALPGTHTTRGDWFLSLAKGSRSHRMGERAMDLLSTRRANIVRLQTGIGLPVRETDANSLELWTSLWHIGPGGKSEGRVTYDQLQSLATLPLNGTNPQTGKPEKQSMQWLWRSRIRHYDLHARVFRRWTCYILRSLMGKLQHQTGISLYDGLKAGTATSKLKTWMNSEIERFITTLNRATPHQPD